MKSYHSPWQRPLQRFYWHSVLALTVFFMVGTLLLVLLVRGTLSGADIRLALQVGGPVGLLVAALEVYVYPPLFARLRLGARLALGLLLYLAGFWLLLFLIRRIFAPGPGNILLDALDAEGFRGWRSLAVGPEGRAFVRLLTGYGILSLFTSLLYQLSNKIGRPALLRLFLGRYHHPVAEQRIFLFVDVKGSTTLAEQLGNERYSQFIRDFFFDMGAPIVAHRGEIYQYVGDEVVVTWEWKTGIGRARCVGCFFAMQQAIDLRRTYYLRTYGTVPVFKAGLHGGPVMATQVGAVKTELVFHGDVLNTTARIEAQCNALHSRLLLSASLYDALPHPPEFRFEAKGEFPLRGKAGTVALYSAETKA
ncbi:adenylate/guanylate cyclase domain-containing protein [Hymenobacter properus]|uniref:Adenylate/guanylate cyclase domain-containing protein n=1 Tax=Hymenobacter properus TaxID=2791026 RepID=A0A931BBA8_9BACT|nr:adenylate/guanylate cyclase domain-containing protein [Hymenobacter properus]MBF9140604.1 adenylate/guanylate cyclase domain-containing protein [Hymenobacter properus]MBR7719412.1 adenylate/guanylate cyclase domain-containing protein [Microvirga sp. SRT04]